MARTGDDLSSHDDYGPDYYRSVEGLDEIRRFNSHWWSARFYAGLASRVLRSISGRRVLEVGCAHGYILARLESRYESFGIDLSPYAIERAKQNAPGSRIWCGDFMTDLPPDIRDTQFDLILAKYVLEHLDDPGAALLRMHDLLRPGGSILYSVPNMISPGVRMKGDDWFAFLDPTHVSMLQPQEWRDLTQTTGFNLTRAFSDGLWDVPYVSWAPTFLQRLIFSLPTFISVALMMPLVPARWGENLIVIAHKPADR